MKIYTTHQKELALSRARQIGVRLASVQTGVPAELLREWLGLPPEEKKKKKKRAPRAPKPKLRIQSPMGGEITLEEIRAKVPKEATDIYVRVDENKIYWVAGEEKGSVSIW